MSRASSRRYMNVDSQNNVYEQRNVVPWYWKFIALVASWMILAGYLILPGLYAKQPELKLSEKVLSVFVVALLTAGYSFTALLCFACRDEIFQAESVFLPALASSALGLLTIAYNFVASTSYIWGTAAITGTAISTISTILYGFLLLWTQRRIVQLRDAHKYSIQKPDYYSEPSFYNNFLQNAYPSATNTPETHPPPITEDERINQSLATLLARRSDDGSPDAAIGTYHIDLPEDQELAQRLANSSELLGSPPIAQPAWSARTRSRRNESLSEEQAWERWDRGRTTHRPTSMDARSSHSRAKSREERRREIEMGQVPV